MKAKCATYSSSGPCFAFLFLCRLLRFQVLLLGYTGFCVWHRLVLGQGKEIAKKQQLPYSIFTVIYSLEDNWSCPQEMNLTRSQNSLWVHRPLGNRFRRPCLNCPSPLTSRWRTTKEVIWQPLSLWYTYIYERMVEAN